MSVKSRIYTTDVVDNQNPRAKADTIYFVAYLEEADGTLKAVLLTDTDIQKGLKRAAANAEDVPPAFVAPVVVEATPAQKSWLDKLLGR